MATDPPEQGSEPEASCHDAPSTDPFVDAEVIAARDARERKLAAIRAHKIKPGEVKNPEGHNGRQLMTAMRRALNKDGRRDELCEVAVEKAIGGDIAWARFCADYDDGKPIQSVALDHTSSDGSMSPAVDAVECALRAALAAKVAEAEVSPETGDAGQR